MEERISSLVIEKRLKALTTAIDFLNNFDEELIKEDVKTLKTLKSIYINKRIHEQEAMAKEIHGYNSISKLSCIIKCSLNNTDIKIFDKENNLIADLSTDIKINIKSVKRKVVDYAVRLDIKRKGNWKWHIKE